MKDHLKRMAGGNFIYHQPVLELPVSPLTAEVAKSTVGRQVFVLCAAVPVKGVVWSSNTRVRLLEPMFSGTECSLSYEINTVGLEQGMVLSGSFNIVSSAGEAVLPYEFKIAGGYFDTSVGPADNLFHFANLVQTAPEEALTCFASPRFKEIFLQKERGLSNTYDMLCRGSSAPDAVEEFLIAARKKVPVSLSLSENMKRLEEPGSELEDRVVLGRSGWGYLTIEVETDAPFIRLENRRLTTEDFTGSRYELSYVLDVRKMHAGRNYGRISIRSFNQQLSLEIEVDCAGQAHTMREKRTALEKLTREYLNYRMKKTSVAVWIEHSNQILDRIRGLDGDDLYFRLVQAQLYFAQRRQQEGEWLLERVKAEMDGTEPAELYCYYLYVHSLAQKDERYTAKAAARVKQYYENGHDGWRMLWLLFYLEPSYGNNQSIKLLRIKDVCHAGCISPVMYLEALLILNAQPVLLRVLNHFELQVLNFGCKYQLVSEKLALQAAALIDNEKIAAPPMLRILKKLNDAYASDEILGVLVKQMVRNELTGSACFEFYEKGILRGFRITQLYEYYIKSMDWSRRPRLPKMVLMYFAYDSALDYASKAYLYANILENEKSSGELMNVYGPQMERFAREQLAAHHLDDNLLKIYREMWGSWLIDEQTAAFMVQVMFTYKVTCYSPGIVSVTVKHKERNDCERVPVVGGVAYIQMYTENCAVVFEDLNGIYRKDSIQYEIERAFSDESLLELLTEKNTGNIYLMLYLYESRKKHQSEAADIFENVRCLMRSTVVAEPFKIELNAWLIGYYDEFNDAEGFRSCFGEIRKDGLAAADAVRLIEVCIQQGMPEDAFDLVKQYSCEGTAPVKMFRLARRMLELRGFEEDETLTEICTCIFQQKKYSEEILQYMVLFYNGTNEEMYYVWKACQNFRVDARQLAERLISQMLFTGEHNGRLTEVFGFYYSSGANKEVVHAYIAYHCFLYFVKNKKVNDIVFRVLEQELWEDGSWPDVCRVSLLKYFSQKIPELTESRKKMAQGMLDELCSENKLFEFYKKFAGVLDLPFNMIDQTIVEYRADPAAKVEIHYYLNEDAASEETEIMKNCGGVFVKNFTLFYGDSLQYYFTEECNGEHRQSEHQHLLCSSINPERTEGRFDYLNDMLASRELHDMATMKKRMHGYTVQDYVGSQLFKRL